MSGYKAEQDWLMGEIEAGEKQLEERELIETVAAIDPTLRARIVIVMRAYKSFAKLTEPRCFGEWKTAYLAQNPEVIKVLEKARHLFDGVPDIEL